MTPLRIHVCVLACSGAQPPSCGCQLSAGTGVGVPRTRHGRISYCRSRCSVHVFGSAHSRRLCVLVVSPCTHLDPRELRFPTQVPDIVVGRSRQTYVIILPHRLLGLTFPFWLELLNRLTLTAQPLAATPSGRAMLCSSRGCRFACPRGRLAQFLCGSGPCCRNTPSYSIQCGVGTCANKKIPYRNDWDKPLLV